MIALYIMKNLQDLLSIKTAWSKSKISLLMWTVVLSLFVLLESANSYQTSRNEDLIQDKTLQYTKLWWWIDRWHANPSSAKKLWNDITNLSSQGDRSYELVRYSQHQEYNGIKTWVTKEYLVKTKLTTKEKESVALAIFLDVSLSFEEHQSWSDFLTKSSYSDPDLFSNVVGFYRAIRWYTRKDITNYLEWYNINESLSLYQNFGIGKNFSTSEVTLYDIKEKKTESYPSRFFDITPAIPGDIEDDTILFAEL